MIRFHPRASAEIAADYKRYQRQRPGRGDRFIAALDRVFAAIVEGPDRFPFVRPPRVRSAKVPRFPYRIVYVVHGGDVFVVAVAHARRPPGYWRRRVT